MYEIDALTRQSKQKKYGTESVCRDFLLINAILRLDRRAPM